MLFFRKGGLRELPERCFWQGRGFGSIPNVVSGEILSSGASRMQVLAYRGFGIIPIQLPAVSFREKREGTKKEFT